MLPEQIAVTLLVTNTLDALSVPYAIGGSLVSALHVCWEGLLRKQNELLLVYDWPHLPRGQGLGAVLPSETPQHRPRTAEQIWESALHMGVPKAP